MKKENYVIFFFFFDNADAAANADAEGSEIAIPVHLYRRDKSTLDWGFERMLHFVANWVDSVQQHS